MLLKNCCSSAPIGTRLRSLSLTPPTLQENRGRFDKQKKTRKKPNTRVEIEQKVNLTVMTEENKTVMEYKYSIMAYNKSPHLVSST